MPPARFLAIVCWGRFSFARVFVMWSYILTWVNAWDSGLRVKHVVSPMALNIMQTSNTPGPCPS